MLSAPTLVCGLSLALLLLGLTRANPGSDGYLSDPVLKFAVFSANSTVTFRNPFSLASSSQFTVGFWIKRGDCPSTSLRYSLLTCNSALSLYLFMSTLYFTVPVLTTTMASSASLCGQKTARWTNVAAVFSNSELRWIMDGVADGTAGKTAGGSKVLGDSSELCYLGNDGLYFGVSAWIRHFYVRATASSEARIASGLHALQPQDTDLLIYLRMDSGTLADMYRSSLTFTADAGLRYGRSNEPEFVCYCTGNGLLLPKFDVGSTVIQSTTAVAQTTRFTAELWVYFTQLSAEEAILIQHENFWKLAIEPSSQTWVLSFYSTVKAAYRPYTTLRFAPLNTWLYVAVQFDYNKAALVSYPTYTTTGFFSLEAGMHDSLGSGNGIVTVGGKFKGFVHSLKYWNSLNELPEASITYPAATPLAPVPDVLQYYYLFTYGNFNAFLEANGAYRNLGSKTSECVRLTASMDFADAPPQCSSTSGPVFSNGVCPGTVLRYLLCVDKGYYLASTSVSKGVVSWISTVYPADLTAEFWVLSTDAQQASTLLEVQGASGTVYLRATLGEASFICYPSVAELGTNIKAKVLVDQGRWGHYTCTITGAVSTTVAMFHNATAVLVASTNGGALTSKASAYYNVYVGAGLQGALREVRLWKGALAQSWIESYLFQTIDTTDMLATPTPPLLYFPFNTETEVLSFQSGMSSADSAGAKLVANSDYANMKYTTLSQDLVICPLGQFYVSGSCVTPTFELRIEDLQTDYRVSLATNVPIGSTTFSYKWLAPVLVPASAEVSEYLGWRIGNITENKFTIFKPLLKADFSATFEVDITPSIYTKYFGITRLTKQYTLTTSIGCPVLTLNNTVVELSNLAMTRSTVSVTLSTCSIPYDLLSLEWKLVGGLTGLSYFTVASGNPAQIAIAPEQFSNYEVSTQYTLSCTASISMRSAAGETVTSTASTTGTVTRHEYRIVFGTQGVTTVASTDNLTLKGMFSVTRDSVSVPSANGELVNTVTCAGRFVGSICDQFWTGISIGPEERMRAGIKAGTYYFSVTGTWRTLRLDSGVSIMLLGSSPAVARKLTPKLFYDYLVYELAPTTASSICKMSDIDYRWYNTSRSYPSTLIAETYELKVSKTSLASTPAIIVELLCNTTDKRSYEIMDNAIDTGRSIAASEVGVGLAYAVTPLKDPVVANLNSVDATATYLLGCAIRCVGMWRTRWNYGTTWKTSGSSLKRCPRDKRRSSTCPTLRRFVWVGTECLRPERRRSTTSQ